MTIPIPSSYQPINQALFDQILSQLNWTRTGFGNGIFYLDHRGNRFAFVSDKPVNGHRIWVDPTLLNQP